MSIPESVNNLKAVMGTLPAAFNAAVAKKRDATVHADVVNTLNNHSEAEVQANLDGVVTTHINDHIGHALTPSQAGTYSKTNVDQQMAPFPSMTSSPISQYGELGFIPVGATAFFEGATFNSNAQYCTLNIEDDGTLVYLRNGTNGSRNGVYYMYSPNAVDGALVAPIRTNKRYQPPFFPAGITAGFVCISGDGVIAGRCQNEMGELGDYFLASTAGTFDDTNHQGCFISPGDATLIWDGNPEVFAANDGGAYIVAGLRFLSDKTPYAFRLWHVTKAQLISGGRITPTLLTGWTTQSWYGPRSNNELIVLADIAQSNNPADSTMYYSSAFGNIDYQTVIFHQSASPYTTSVQDENGMIRVRVICYLYTSQTSTGRASRAGFVNSFTINPAARTAQYDAGCNGPAVMHPETPKISFTGNVIVDVEEVAYSITPGRNDGHNLALYYHQPTGQWFSFASYILPDEANYVAKSRNRAGAISKFDALHYASRCNGDPQLNTYPLFGSAVGGTITGSTEVPGNRMLVTAMGRGKAGSTLRGLVLAERGAAGHTYLSKNNGSYSGYAPSAKREFLVDMGLQESEYDSLLSEVSYTGTTVLSGGHFHQTHKFSGPVNIDADLNPSGRMSVPETMFDQLKTFMRNQLGLPQNISDHLTVIVPQNLGLPVIGLYFCNNNHVGQLTAFEMSVASGSRTGLMSDFSVVSHSPTIDMPEYIVEIVVGGPEYMWQLSGGAVIYETPDSYLFGALGKVHLLLSGSYASYDVRFAIPKSTNRPDWSTMAATRNYVGYSATSYTAIPGVGFGYNVSSSTVSDEYTKLVFKRMARNLAEFKAWSVQDTQVQVSQDVAQGWLVYFTQEVPFLLNNQYGRMPATTLNLTSYDPDPANKEFLIYLTGSAKYGFSYSLTNFANAENAGVMYIGKVVTGDTSILTIDIEKVTRLGTYRVSTTKQGSSIPATAGNPAETAHLIW